MSVNITDSIKENFKTKINKAYESYINDLTDRTKSTGNFITITELEEKLLEVKKINSKLFDDATSEILNHVNENELVKFKKI